MLVIAAQRNIRKDQTCYVVNESLIQKTDMSVKLVANILQESSVLQVTNVLQKRVKLNKNSYKRRNGTASKTKKTNTQNLFNPKLLWNEK